MSTQIEEVSNQQRENNEVEPQTQHEELQKEEEPVDIELQKQMQKVTIDESIFDKQPKQKQKSQKKSSKKKGQDFLEYANKNNIQITLQYGEEDNNSGSYKKKRMNDQFDQQQQPSNQKRQFKGNNDNYNGGNNNKYKSNYNKSNQQGQGRKGHIKLGGNKFDACNQMPFQNKSIQFQQQAFQYKEVTLTTDEQILSYLERLLSLTSLNRDLYLRYRINDKGMINITELANYYGLKNNEVTPQRIIDIITKNDSVSSIGIIEEEGVINVTIKHWNTISPQLNSIEVITDKKKQMKMQQAQMAMHPQYMPYTYIHMQNNYFLPGVNDMQGYVNNNRQYHS